MKILVLATDYPDNNGKVSLMYIHTRNVRYVKYHEITVLNFRAEEEYVIDGIRVINEKIFDREDKQYDLVLCHAANVRNHYRFLKKHDFKKLIFFFHGHEVLKINKVYPKPYFYKKSNVLRKVLQNVYDDFKFSVWRRFFNKNLDKCSFVFVSKWMKNEFEKWVMPTKPFEDKTYITYNGISKEFEEGMFDVASEKKYDCITIRSFLDGSKYCVDVVCDIAKRNPEMKFCLVGKGEFFEHFEKPYNVEWLNKNMKHDEILNLLNCAKCSLMPTRTDSQGLMACEMASIGMPLITSNIDVCHEIFDDFSNVGFIGNENVDEFKGVYDKLLKESTVAKKNGKYYTTNTIQHELDIFQEIENEIKEGNSQR